MEFGREAPCLSSCVNNQLNHPTLAHVSLKLQPRSDVFIITTVQNQISTNLIKREWPLERATSLEPFFLSYYFYLTTSVTYFESFIHYICIYKQQQQVLSTQRKEQRTRLRKGIEISKKRQKRKRKSF